MLLYPNILPPLHQHQKMLPRPDSFTSRSKQSTCNLYFYLHNTTVHGSRRNGKLFVAVRKPSGVPFLNNRHQGGKSLLQNYNVYAGEIYPLALSSRNRREKIPSAKVCQNHPVAFLGSTLFAKNQAYTPSPRCNATAIAKTNRITNIERKTNKWMSSTHFNGPTGGRQAAENVASIPIVTANQVNMVGPSSSLLFRSCQYEIVAASPSRGLTIGT
jgi:hypothetical protein